MDVAVVYHKDVVSNAKITVEARDGEVALRIHPDRDEERLCLMKQTYAVVLWKCLSKEMDECMFHCRDNDSVGAPEIKQIRVSYDKGSCMWNIRYQDLSFCLDIDEATALSWAIRGCVAHSFSSEPTPVRDKGRVLNPQYVYVLSSRRVLTGDAAADGCDLIGGSDEVFWTEEKARDRLREFMRPLVNESEPESHWDYGTNVDDVLDRIIERGQCRCYSYDGGKQSFEVRIAKVEVK